MRNGPFHDDDDFSGRLCWRGCGVRTTTWTWQWRKRSSLTLDTNQIVTIAKKLLPYYHRSTKKTYVHKRSSIKEWINWPKVKSALVDVQPNLFKFYDQRILQFKVFPLVWSSRSTLKSHAIHSYRKKRNFSVNFSLKDAGERHCCNLRQLQLWNYLEVWPLSTLANQATGVQVSNCSWMIFVGQALVPPGTWVTVQPRTMLWGLWGGRDARWNADQRRTRIGNTAEQIEPIPD